MSSMSAPAAGHDGREPVCQRLIGGECSPRSFEVFKAAGAPMFRATHRFYFRTLAVSAFAVQ